MYNYREKAQRDYQWVMRAAREEGREEGRIQGAIERGAVVGKIQLLQQLLGEEESSMPDLREVSFKELSDKLAVLQQRYCSRGD